MHVFLGKTGTCGHALTSDAIDEVDDIINFFGKNFGLVAL
jgi:hypothetical protein